MYLNRYPSLNTTQPWKNDFLDRKNFANSLKELIYNTSSGLTILIRSPFGTGKSYFAKNFYAELFKNNKYAIYIDVFEKEYMIEPIIILMESIYSNFENLKKENKFLEIINQIKNIDLSVSVNYGLMNFSMALNKNNSLYVDNVLKFKEKVEELRKCIKNISNFMDENNEKFIIIIDELDRCSPDFSLKVIETLKLFFNYKNIVFILLTDDKVIDSIAEIKYGKLFHYNYLEKYIDIDLNLPSINYEAYIDNLLNFLNNDMLNDEDKILISTLSNTFIKNLLKKINLRQITDIINMMFLFPKSEKTEEFIYRFLLFTMLIFKIIHRENFIKKNWMYFMEIIENTNDIHFELLFCLLHPSECKRNQKRYSKVLDGLAIRSFDIEDSSRLVNRIHSLVSSMNIPS